MMKRKPVTAIVSLSERHAVGKDVDTRGNIRSGSILIESMTVAGS